MIGKEEYVTPKPGIIITYNGSFNLDKLYKDTKKWFKSHEYLFTEKEYKEKTQAHGNEIKIDFIAERKIDDYMKFNILANFLILNVKKLSEDTYIGNLHLNIIGYIDLDYNNKWQNNPIKKFLFFIYNNLIIKNKLENLYDVKLYNEVLDFESLIKKNLEML